MTEKYTLIIIGAFCVCYGLICALRYRQSGSWNSVPGCVVKLVKKIERTDGGKLEYADIAYEYVFGGKTYTSSAIKIGGDLLSSPSKNESSEADVLLRKYPVGEAVNVYVHPKHPKTSCLERSGAEAIFVSIVGGALAVVTGLYFEEILNYFSF